MNAKAASHDFRQLLHELRQLSRDGESGTLFIRTGDNHSARITLDEGDIVASAYTSKKGCEAMKKIKLIASCSFSFNEGLLLDRPSKDLPDTGRIFSFLEAEQEPAAEQLLNKEDDAEAFPTSASIAGSEDPMDRIQVTLAEFIGPMATVLCDEFRTQIDGTDNRAIASVVEQLSHEISNESERQRFRLLASERLMP